MIDNCRSQYLYNAKEFVMPMQCARTLKHKICQHLGSSTISNSVVDAEKKEFSPKRFLSLCTWTFCGPRYGILACGELPDSFIEGRQATEIIMKQTKIDELEYRFGQDKVCCAATLSSAIVLFLLLSRRQTLRSATHHS